jgi:hypothetical protein
MKLTCTKHRFFPLLGLITTKNSLRYNVDFVDAKVDPKNNQINKLFGFGELSFRSIWWAIKNLKPIHHYNSVRWGWSFDNYRNMFALYAYRRIKGELEYDLLTRAVFPHDYEIELSGKYATFLYDDQVMISIPYENSLLKLHLNPYFGGKIPTTRKITLKFTK